MNILLLSRYSRLGPSSRLRSYQYLPHLKSAGFSVTVAPLLNDRYVESLYRPSASQPATLNAGIAIEYISRLMWILSASRFDIVWIEKEALPWIPAVIELGLFSSGARLVVDYDDAVFHRYDEHSSWFIRKMLETKMDAIMRRANLVTVGNEYLAARAREAGAKWVEFLPTVVDLDRYRTTSRSPSAEGIVIGWIGNPVTARHLRLIGNALVEVGARLKAPLKVLAIGANTDQMANLPIETRPWAEATEVNDVGNFDIGVMPLPDESFERGKCGYKLIQYMALGKPVVASPVGANKQIVDHGVNGFLANSMDEWVNSLLLLCTDAELRDRLGRAGRAKVEATYSLQRTAPLLARLFTAVAK